MFYILYLGKDIYFLHLLWIVLKFIIGIYLLYYNLDIIQIIFFLTGLWANIFNIIYCNFSF